jgi:hypothetical protein
MLWKYVAVFCSSCLYTSAELYCKVVLQCFAVAVCTHLQNYTVKRCWCVLQHHFVHMYRELYYANVSVFCKNIFYTSVEVHCQVALHHFAWTFGIYLLNYTVKTVSFTATAMRISKLTFMSNDTENYALVTDWYAAVIQSQPYPVGLRMTAIDCRVKFAFRTVPDVYTTLE